ncbi:MAG: head-tail connector protein [Pseudomonadota bacterium]
MYRRVTVADFGVAALTTADAKAHLRVDTAHEDALIADYVDSATRYVEKVTGTALRPQTWTLTLDRFLGRRQPLPGGRVTAVSAVKYYDVSEALVTMPPADYVVSLGLTPAIVEAPNGWPGTQVREGAVQITYTVDGSDEPGLVEAVKLLVTHRYENRGVVSDRAQMVPVGFDDYIQMHAAAWYG